MRVRTQLGLGRLKSRGGNILDRSFRVPCAKCLLVVVVKLLQRAHCSAGQADDRPVPVGALRGCVGLSVDNEWSFGVTVATAGVALTLECPAQLFESGMRAFDLHAEAGLNQSRHT